jgi:hypothetical protein
MKRRSAIVDSGYARRHRQLLAAANDVWRCAGCSGDLPPPSPPAEQATAGQDQAGF